MVQDIEATNVGIGVAIHGEYNLVTRGFFHDLTMVVNTQEPRNDDYGAVGVWLFSSNNEVSYNTMADCKASSFDYGYDGGAVEWWGVADNNNVHHNFATRSIGFLEVGGGSAKNAVVAYNISVDNGGFSVFHLSGKHSSEIEGFRIENNTIIETATDYQHWTVFEIMGDSVPSAVLIRNNIVWAEPGSGRWGGLRWVSNNSSFVHESNMYHLSGGIELGFELGSGEMIADPLFEDMAQNDFHLRGRSLAIDSGLDLGHSFDFGDDPVPSGVAPDLGALEHRP